MGTSEDYSVRSFIKNRFQAGADCLLSLLSGSDSFFNKFDKSLSDMFDDTYSVPYGSPRASPLIALANKSRLLLLVPLDEFIPIAERSGLILEVGDIVFHKVREFLSSSAVKGLGIR